VKKYGFLDRTQGGQT